MVADDRLSPAFIVRCQESVVAGHTNVVPPEWLPLFDACFRSGIYLEPYGPEDFLPRYTDEASRVVETLVVEALATDQRCGLTPIV